jgi:hypothetical protein
VGSETYIVSANEGDSREYEGIPGFVDETRVSKLMLDPAVFPDADELQEDENLGRLKVTIERGDFNDDGYYEALYSYGARSFSIWNAAGELVWDSGDTIEQVTAALLPDDFNSTDDENGSFDDRSDDKGPEPEGVVVGKVSGRSYAFVGLERVGGIMVFDITDPTAPTYVTYANTRDFSGDPESATAGDLAPEGLAFVKADDSATGNPLLIVGYEMSGTTSIFEITLAD